jgi:hypothetical protein
MVHSKGGYFVQHKSMDEHLNDRKKAIKALQMIEDIGIIEPRNLTERIFQKYAELEGAVKAAEYLNTAGHRVKTTKGERKYISKDVIDLLEDESCYDQVDQRILFVALGIKNQQSRYQNWLSKIMKICDDYPKFIS